MSEPPSTVGRRSRVDASTDTSAGTGSSPVALATNLIRGYPPVLGAMLLVDGVLTVILGGDATVSLGEVVAYLLLPPLAMFLLTQLTGGRRPNPVTIGTGVAGAAVIFAALFLGGGVHLVTLPGWVLALLGLVLLGVAVLLMRRSAPVPPAHPVPPLSTPAERDEFALRDDRDDPDHGDFDDRPATTPRDDYGPRAGAYGEPEWPSSREDEPAYPAARGSDETAGLPRVPPAHAGGPAEPEWPPRRDPIGAGPTWSDPDGAQPAWSQDDRPAPVAGSPAPWPVGPSDREWPPAPAAQEWPPRRDPEPAPEPAPDGGTPRSWFEAEDPPADPAWSPDPSDREWPPTSGGRRSRHPEQ